MFLNAPRDIGQIRVFSLLWALDTDICDWNAIVASTNGKRVSSHVWLTRNTKTNGRVGVAMEANKQIIRWTTQEELELTFCIEAAAAELNEQTLAMLNVLNE